MLKKSVAFKHSQSFDQMSPEFKGCRADPVCVCVCVFFRNTAAMKCDMLQR